MFAEPVMFARALMRVNPGSGTPHHTPSKVVGTPVSRTGEDLSGLEAALPEKNEWNEESPTAGKSGKRPYRPTPPSCQSSLYYRRLARSGKNKLKGKWARLESRPANSPDSFGSASSSV